MYTKEQAKENLTNLVAKFKAELDAGKTDEYNEESTKKSFIEPLLEKVLCWDISNHDEVSMEHRVSRDRVDYGIKLDSKVRFFVEAKQIKADLKKAIPQAVKYCYNRKDVPFVMLTDFKDLMFFDAGFKPDLRYPKKGLKIDLNWENYVEHFDELWLLSKESVIAGSLDKIFSQASKAHSTIDKDILSDLENWREHLAKNIYKNNLDIFHSKDRDADSLYLKEVAQKILDRIIFIRFCEDKQLTQMQHMKPRFDARGETTGLNTMFILRGIFQEYEAIFNSDLFAVKDWEKDLKIEFIVMNKIIQQTYDPYMFDAIPLEILGNIYEQYLGYTIKLAGDSIKYELKPEVRKAGGVYYTPEYVVNYIIKNTVGKLLTELSEAKAKKIRILDPACGSGTFLIRAYDEMLKYYLNLKKQSKASIAKGQTAIETGETGTRLTIEEKVKILKEHIYGVDLDNQSIEVTKLSLMLKMLEGEDGFVKGTHLLPMLDDNIHCGNSLISGNVLEINKYFGNDSHKIRAFNWEDEFKNIIVEEGGFDAVVGNPPWGSFFEENEKQYLFDKYVNSKGEPESHLFFIQKGCDLLKKNRTLGFITPNTWLSVLNSKQTRDYLLKNYNFLEVIELGDNIFEDAPAIVPIICFLEKNKSKDNRCSVLRSLVKRVDGSNFNERNTFSKELIKQEVWELQKGNEINLRLTEKNLKVIEKYRKNTIPLSEIATVLYGIKTGDNTKYLSKKKTEKHKVKALKTSEVSRYHVEWNGLYLWWTNSLAGYRKNNVEVKKIVIQYIRNLSLKRRIVAGMDVKGEYYPLNNYSYVESKADGYSLEFILAILNSSAINFYFSNTFIDYNIKPTYLSQLPIPKTDTLNKELVNRIEKLVKVIIANTDMLNVAKGSEADNIETQITKTDSEIDKLVYQMYDLTDGEIEIIENKMKQNVRVSKAE